MMEKIKSFYHQHPIITICLIQGIILLLYILSSTMKYEVSDDFMMQLLVSNGYHTSYSSNMMFSSPLFGLILSFSYRLFPFINWYFWIQVILIYISLCACSYVLLKHKKSTFLYCMGCILLLLIAKDCYQLMQFTKSATLLISAGVLLFLDYMQDQHLFKCILSITLMIIGTFLRRKCMFMVLPYLCFYFIYIIWTKKAVLSKIELKKKTQQIILIMMSMLIMYGATGWISDQYLHDRPAEGAYTKFNSARSKINDYPMPAYGEIEKELKQLNISQNDYELFLSWNFGDERYYSEKWCQQVYDVVSKYQASQGIDIGNSIYDMIKRKYWEYYYFWICGLIIILGAIWYKKGWVNIGFGLICAALLFYNSLQGRNVYRVEASTMLVCGLFSLYYLLSCEEKKDHLKEINRLGKGALIFMMIFTCVDMMPAKRENRFELLDDSWNNRLGKYACTFVDVPYQNLIDECVEHQENTYFLGFQTMIQSMYLNFDVRYDNGNRLFENCAFFAGVDTHHPSKQSWLHNKGFSTSMSALLKPNVYLIENECQNQILQFLREHESENIQMKLYKEIDGFKIWKYERVKD